MNRARVLLADDHQMVTEGLKNLLADDFEVVGAVEDGRALLVAAKTLRPDVIVADISMPQLNGIEALQQLKKHNPDVKVVFLTMHQNRAYARRALQAGASGFVVKHSASHELVMAINAALKGQTFITPVLAGDVLLDIEHGAKAKKSAKSSVTPREREILQFLAEGKSAKEIGEILSISARTVEFHKYQLMEMQGIHSSAELMQFAIKQGIVTI
jgi:DNA-binding NarL/FixJ family response regulator